MDDANRIPEARLLVVDDEPTIRELLVTSLRFAGFEVHAAADGTQALQLAEDLSPDLVVMDVMMPGMDGFEVTRRLRDRGRQVPVVFLTARDDSASAVEGLQAGADDYVTKPFSLDEVLARVRAVLRRTRGAPRSEVLQVADLELDDVAHEVRRAGRPISLSPTEYKLLRYLMVNAGRVVSKGQILDHVWEYDFGGESGIVESYISYLRRKVDAAAGPERALIQTRRGVGYVLRAPL